MAETKYLARDITAEVYAGDGVTRLPIEGLESLTHSPSTERADTTGFDENGRPTHIVAQRGDSWAMTGHAVEDVATGARPAGQTRCEDLAKLIGLSAEGKFRLTSPGGNAIVFNATVELTHPGGAHNDPASWGISVEITGDVIYDAAPAS